jgi:hypothetical protein
MDKQKLIEMLNYREKLWRENDGSDWGTDECWNAFIRIALDDWDGFCSFLTEEAGAMQMVYLSEVMFDLAAKLGNEKVLIPFRKAAEKFPREAEEWNVLRDIRCVENNNY